MSDEPYRPHPDDIISRLFPAISAVQGDYKINVDFDEVDSLRLVIGSDDEAVRESLSDAEHLIDSFPKGDCYAEDHLGLVVYTSDAVKAQTFLQEFDAEFGTTFAPLCESQLNEWKRYTATIRVHRCSASSDDYYCETCGFDPNEVTATILPAYKREGESNGADAYVFVHIDIGCFGGFLIAGTPAEVLPELSKEMDRLAESNPNDADTFAQIVADARALA